MGCANILCPCCTTSEAVTCGQCASKFSWFGPLMAFIGQAWIMFGVTAYLSLTNEIRKTHNHEIVSVAYLAAAFITAASCVRLATEAMCKKAPRFTYFLGSLSFVAAFLTLPFYYQTPFVTYTVSAPLLGFAYAATDTSFRCIMPDQWTDRRVFYVSTSSVFRSCSAISSATISYYVTTILSWRFYFYAIAGMSFIPLMYISYFIPSRLTPVDQTRYTCLRKEQTKVLVALLVAETASASARWALPVFIFMHMIVSGRFSERDLTMFFGIFLSINFIARAARDAVHMKTIQLGRYAYIVAAVTSGFFSACLTFTDSSHFNWVLAALVAVAGFSVGGVDETVIDIFEEEHLIRVSTILTFISGLAALVWLVMLADHVSDDSTDANTPLRIISGACVVPAVCMCYASLPLARQKMYSPLAVGTRPA